MELVLKEHGEEYDHSTDLGTGDALSDPEDSSNPEAQPYLSDPKDFSNPQGGPAQTTARTHRRQGRWAGPVGKGAVLENRLDLLPVPISPSTVPSGCHPTGCHKPNWRCPAPCSPARKHAVMTGHRCQAHLNLEWLANGRPILPRCMAGLTRTTRQPSTSSIGSHSTTRNSERSRSAGSTPNGGTAAAPPPR